MSESLQLEISLSTGTYATVHQSELFAISELCDNDLLKSGTDKDIFICSDSQSAIEAIRSPLVSSKMVLECKTRLNELGKDNKVTVLWVPGHEGIPGNEKADDLARSGADKQFIGPEPKFGISMTTRKHIVKEWLHKTHQKVWSEYEGARHTKIFLGTLSREVSKSIINLSRSDIKRVVEAVTNHCGLNKYLFDINCKDSPMCLCNHAKKTGSHIISDCPRYRYIRRSTLGKPELDAAELKLQSMDINDLATFLRKTNRLSS